MRKLNQLLINAEKHCVSHGVHLTERRKQILSILLDSKKGLSVYQIIDHFKHHFSDELKAMSVYRILDYLESQGLVHKISSTNTFAACTAPEPHQEDSLPLLLVCKQCKIFKEVTIPGLLDFFKNNLSSTNFNYHDSQVEMACLCSLCTT